VDSEYWGADEVRVFDGTGRELLRGGV